MLCLLLAIGVYSYIKIPLTRYQIEPYSSKETTLPPEDFIFSPDKNSLYLAQILIGTPARPYILAIDLLHEYTWVESKYCLNTITTNSKFDPSESSSFKNLSVKLFTGTLASCYIQGSSFSDQIGIQSASSNFFTSLDMILADSKIKCENRKYDGVLSLSVRNSFSSYKFYENLYLSKQIKEPIFALYIKKNHESNEKNLKSVLEIGGFDLTLYSSDPNELFYMPLTNRGNKWSVNFDFFEFGNFRSQMEVINVVFTTAEWLIHGDQNVYLELLPYFHSIGLNCFEERFVVKCFGNNLEELPGVVFGYSNKKIVIPNYRIWKCFNDSCVLMVVFDKAGYWDFGHYFMEQYYMIYDIQDQRIGFAPSVGLDPEDR